MKYKKLPREPETPQEFPIQEGFYETGNTRPPKNHHRFITAMLILYVALGGLYGLSVMMDMDFSGEEDLPHALSFREQGETAPLQILPTEPEAQDAHLPMTRVVLAEAPEAIANIPQEGGLSLQDVYEKVAPSVVSITAATDLGAQAGSGIILSKEGYIITNCHVVEGARDISVALADGAAYTAVLVGRDRISDLAVLRIEARGLTPAEFGSSDKVRVGDSVTAIGSPMGSALPGTMTDGIISAINRNLNVGGSPLTLLQTNAALNSGNSGGPLINCYGQVIGITTAKVGDQYSAAGVEGLGFAIPMSTAKEIVEALIRYGYVPGRPGFGMELEEFPLLYSAYYGLPNGLWVARVLPGSPAEALGILPGSIVTHVDGAPVSTLAQAQSFLADHSVGDTVTVTVYQNGVLADYSLTLTEAVD